MTPRLTNAVLTGERVVLEPVRPEDAPAAYGILAGNDAILRWLVWEGPSCVEELEEAYGHWMTPSENGDNYQLAIRERATGAFLGAIGPRFAGHPQKGDVGYWLDPGAWGRGVMSEAVRLVNHLGFRHLGAEAMTATVFVGNTGSRRVLEKNGYSLMHVAEGQVFKHGTAIDEWVLVLLRREFERAQRDWSPVEEIVEFEAP